MWLLVASIFKVFTLKCEIQEGWNLKLKSQSMLRDVQHSPWFWTPFSVLMHPLSIIWVWHGYCLIFFVVEGSLSSSRLRKKREASKLKPSGGTNINSGVQSPAMKASEMVNCWTFVPGPSFYVVKHWTPLVHCPPSGAKRNVWNDVYTKPKAMPYWGTTTMLIISLNPPLSPYAAKQTFRVFSP